MLGTYQVTIRVGNDGNTLLAPCNRQVPVGSVTSFTLSDDPPASFLSARADNCKPLTIGVKLSNYVQCSSIASDGTDFIVTGNSSPVVISAAYNCLNGFTDSVTLTLNNTITIGGNYQVRLQSGSDGNTLLSNCNRPSAVGIFTGFTVADTVAADFTYQVLPGCTPATVIFNHTPGNPVSNWSWTINGSAAGSSNSAPPPAQSR